MTFPGKGGPPRGFLGVSGPKQGAPGFSQKGGEGGERGDWASPGARKRARFAPRPRGGENPPRAAGGTLRLGARGRKRAHAFQGPGLEKQAPGESTGFPPFAEGGPRGAPYGGHGGRGGRQNPPQRGLRRGGAKRGGNHGEPGKGGQKAPRGAVWGDGGGEQPRFLVWGRRF